MLAPATAFNCYLRYHIRGIPGAMPLPFLEEEVIQRLSLAEERLRILAGPTARLLLWDAYRTKETQTWIFEKYASDLILENSALSKSEANQLALQFVTSPDTNFPHGTGGAVDLTFMHNGTVVNMGTEFDEFLPNSYADFFERNEPNSPDEKLAKINRRYLNESMHFAGFVGIECEWWHFEFGTDRWGRKTGQVPLFQKMAPPPALCSPAASTQICAKQPSLEAGVAQIFYTPEVRAASLAHKTRDHYYARTSHPTTDELKKFLSTNVTPAKFCALVPSGLAACTQTIEALMPYGGILVYDTRIYYETHIAILTAAKKFDWKLIRLDFSTIASDSIPHGADVFYCDNPCNWFLDAFPLSDLAYQIHKTGSLLVVDTSVQPLQDALQKGVDIVVSSLSKYPSSGLTVGGAIYTNDSHLYNRLIESNYDGCRVMSAETAYTIWCQAVTIRDRMDSLSRKTELIAAFLAGNPLITQVRLPDKRHLDGFCGGQLSFHLRNVAHGSRMEQIIGHNSIRTSSCLHLACTFGAVMTTFEHFGSNKRCRPDNSPHRESNESAIPSDLVRIGVGYEACDKIVAELDLILKLVVII